MKRVTIVGGGISGLSAAYYLSKAGHHCTVIEAEPVLGGVIRTEKLEGCTIEGGPDSFISQKPWALELIRDLGIEDQVIGSNDHLRKTFVLRGGRLVPLPEGVQFMAPTKAMPMLTTRLLGIGTKTKMAVEWFRRPRQAGRERTVAEFVEEHFGTEAVEYLAQPMLAGVYGGAPEKLSVDAVLPRFVELERRYGSVSKGLLRAANSRPGASKGSRPKSLFLSLQGGMKQLVDALLKHLTGKVDFVTAKVQRIERRGGSYEILLDKDQLASNEVLVATPAYRAAELIRTLDSTLAQNLDAVPYTSSVTVNLIYARPPFEHNLQGFGFLVPRAEKRRLTACTWVNTKFSHRAAAGRAVLRAFLSDQQADKAFDLPDEEIAALVHEELSELMRFQTKPTAWRVHRWRRAMAQYELGHQKRVREIDGRLGNLEGLHLSGNAFHGIGIPDCVRRSKQIAEKISAEPGNS